MMVAHFTMRTYVVNQEFRFVKGIWLMTERIVKFEKNRKRPIFTSYTCATCSELPSFISIMDQRQKVLRKCQMLSVALFVNCLTWC